MDDIFYAFQSMPDALKFTLNYLEVFVSNTSLHRSIRVLVQYPILPS
ncbi:hypothetical protein [Hydrotalea flava]|nr:hypothetical protein [Hydrotalea flava]